MSESGKEVVEAKDKVRMWLTEENMIEKSVDEVKTAWNFHCKLNGRMPFAVYQVLSSVNRVVVAAEMRLSDIDKKNLTSLGDKGRREFLWDLQFGLLQTGCFFDTIPNVENLERLRFSKHIFYDGLSKQNLMDTIFLVYRCWVLLIWKLRRMGKVITAEVEEGYSMPYG